MFETSKVSLSLKISGVEKTPVTGPIRLGLMVSWSSWDRLLCLWRSCRRCVLTSNLSVLTLLTLGSDIESLTASCGQSYVANRLNPLEYPLVAFLLQVMPPSLTFALCRDSLTETQA